MQPLEQRSAISIATIFGLRLFGLITLLPILSLYAEHFQGSTPLLIGVALGIYGLTQAIFQLPLGMLSDRIGRKSVITVGLLVLAVGSALCAVTTTVMGLIVGRALQGACAIGSTLMAMLADLTGPDQRTKAMAIIGGMMGIVFSSALALGPILSHLLGIRGIFWLTVMLAIIAIVLTNTWVPTPSRSSKHQDVMPILTRLTAVAKRPILWRLNLSATLGHALLIANFTVLPVLIKQRAKLANEHLWYLYVPILLAAFLLMLPLMIVTEKRRCFKLAIVGSVVLIACAEFVLWLMHYSIFWLAIGLLAFFVAFSFLEAVLPSLISRLVSSDNKGTAMGLYSTSQFLGIFLGGLVGGLVYGHYSPDSVLLLGGVLAILWFLTLISGHFKAI